MATNPGNHRILDEFHWISRAGVFGLAVVVVIGSACMRIEGYIFQHAAESQGIPDLRLILLRELDALGIASALEVEDAVGAPAMFVIADEIARRVRGERRLSSAGKTKEERGNAIVSDIC